MRCCHVGVVVAEVAVLVFDLGHEDGTAVAELEWGDFLGEAVDPALGGDHEGGVVGAEDAADFGSARSQAGKPPNSHSAQDVGAGAEDDVEAFLLSFADELGEVVVAGEVEVAGRGLVDVPEDVGGDGVEAHGAGHLETCVPVLAGDAGVVEFAGEDFEGLAVEDEVIAFGCEGVITGGCGLPRGWERCENKEAEDQSADGWVH